MNPPPLSENPPAPPAPTVADVAATAATILGGLALQSARPEGEDPQRLAQRRRELLRTAELPKRAAEWCRSRAGLAAEPWRLALAKIVRKLGTGFTMGLCGQQSRGKTTMAVSTALHAIEAGRSVVYVKGDRMAELYDAARHPTDDTEMATEAAVTDWLCAPALLIVDEVGKMRDTDYILRKLFLVLDTRYDASRDTLLISNLDKLAFDSLLGCSLLERMAESGGTILCDWQGFRGEKM